jgi:hypothetical protein
MGRSTIGHRSQILALIRGSRVLNDATSRP